MPVVNRLAQEQSGSSYRNTFVDCNPVATIRSYSEVSFPLYSWLPQTIMWYLPIYLWPKPLGLFSALFLFHNSVDNGLLPRWGWWGVSQRDWNSKRLDFFLLSTSFALNLATKHANASTSQRCTLRDWPACKVYIWSSCPHATDISWSLTEIRRQSGLC